MIPVSLKIKGLYSFQEEQTIDFAKLIDAQIFGIFGNVGSGKSTVLEAISFALFSNTERLNSRDNRNYNMMNLKSNELLIDFEFENYDGIFYKFVVSGKRHNSEFNKVNSFQRSAYKKENGNWIPIEKTTAEDIVGLSYENFRRTIIIPQGQFQEFLDLGDKDRTNMLKELFHLGKYDFYYQAASLEKKNNEHIQHLSGQLTQYEHTTQENIQARETAANALAKELEMLRAELSAKQIHEKEQKELKKVFEELQQKQEILKNLLTKEPEIAFYEKKVNQYESCVQLFKNSLLQQKEATARLNEKSKLLSETTESLRVVNETLDAAQKEFKLIEPEFQNLELRKDEINDYQQAIKIQKLLAEIADLEKRISIGEEKLLAENQKKTDIIAAITAQKSLIQTKKENLPDMPELTEVKTWFAVKMALEKNNSALSAEKTRFETTLKDKKTDIQAKIPAVLKTDHPYNPEESLGVYIQKLEKQKDLNGTKSEAIQELINHLNLQSRLEEFTQKLHDHEACPLCGSLEHPNILRIENVQEARKDNEEKLENTKRETSLIESTIQQLTQAEFEQQELTVQIESTSAKIESEDKALKLHLHAFKWSKYSPDNEKLADEALENSKTEFAAISLLEKELETLEQSRTAAESKFDQFNTLLQELKNQIQIKQGEKDTFTGLVKTLDLSQINLTEAELQVKTEELELFVKSVAEKHENLSRQIIAMNQQQLVLQERVTSTNSLVQESTQQLEKIAAELSKNLGKSNFIDLEEVNRILANEIDTERLKTEISEFRQALFKAKSDVAELEKATEGKQFNAELYAELTQQLQLLENKLQTQRDLFVTESAALEKLKADLIQKQALTDAMEKLHQRDENIKVMKNLFKGSGFVNYISTAYLQNLCEAANERFYKLTRQQLRLEITENNDFQVRDYLNDGKVRSVKTLSGGQTFQAALSLALALAESIQQQNKAKQNFFFLDEGFGSQDKLSLQIVFDSLKSLREENRVIGVISHVEDLQQEIDIYLKMENDNETGSKIHQSWEN